MAKGDGRFRMVKERHAATLQKAIDEKVIDARMRPLCKFIAGTENFFTSSGCAGRILLLGLPKGENKLEAYFHRRWHRAAKSAEVWGALREKTKGEVWLRQEPFIVHLGCANLEHSGKILGAMKKAGVKRGGIIVSKPGKFITELQGTDGMSLPLKKGKKILVGRGYVDYLVREANRKLARNYERLKRFEKACREELA
ncbi:MAG: hypothetical protein V1676_01470 [Candidatus Diapherotrites archaeon]